MKNDSNPYVGPSPFEEKDAPRFYGRTEEATELFSLTRAHSVVLFYSQSGAGKTSLINAGVIPKLQKERFEVFPVARIGVKLPKDITLNRISNVFVFNTLLSLEGEQKRRDFDQLGKMSLSEYLKEGVSNGQTKYSYPLRVLIFDQFEELFTTFPEHWAKREGFFISISEALEQDPLLRIVFAMREEYIAELEPFAPMLPLRFQKRFRLERLRKHAAKRAIEGPVENTTRSYAKNVAEGLVNNLLQQQIKYSTGTRATPGEFVEPVQLQIVCRSLWEELPADVKIIDQTAVSQFGDVDAALAKYYSNCLGKIAAQRPPEFNEAGLRIWFQQELITPVSTRATAYVDEGSTKGVSPEALAILEEQRLIRPELRGGAKWYELTHDRFIEPILKSNKEWFDSLPEGGSFIYELEERAISWDKSGRKLDPEALLSDHTIQKYRKTAKYSDKSTKITPTRLLEEYVNASETAEAKNKVKEFRRQVLVFVIVGLVAVALVAYSIVSSYRISQAKRATTAIQVEKINQAKAYAKISGQEFNGLVLALDAATLSDPEDAPAEAIEGLRAALAVVDRKVWLRYTISFASRPEGLQLSTDGTLALTENNNELCVWNTLTGQKTFDECVARNQAGEWAQTQFSSDGKLVYALVKPLLLPITSRSSASRVNQGSQDTNVTALKQSFVWVVDARNGAVMEQIQTPLQGVESFEISNNSQHILADFKSRGVKIIDVNTRRVRTPSPAKQNLWHQMALSPDGSRLVAVYPGRKVELSATDVDRVISTFDAGTEKSGQWDVISFSPDGNYGVLVRPSAAGNEATGFVWENTSGERLISFKTKARNVDHAALSSDNKLIMVSDRTTMDVIDASTGRLVSSNGLPAEGILLRAGLKTLHLRLGKEACMISVWDAANQSPSPSQYVYPTKGNISMVESTPDGNHLIVLDEDKTVQIWAVTAPLATNELDMERLITEGCKKLLPRKKEFTQFDALCKPRVQSW